MLLTRKSVLAAKIESAAGTAETLAAGDGAFIAYDADISADSEMLERLTQGSFKRHPSIPNGFPGKATFKCEMHSGTAQPAWAAAFLPACGMGFSSTKYLLDIKPVGADGTTQHTITLGLYEDGRLKILYGAMGNCVMTFTSSKVVVCEFTFTGIFDEVTDVALIAPTFPTTPPLKFIDQTLTIGSWTPHAAEVKLDLGNKVYLRPGTSATGHVHAVITDRLPKITMDPEAGLVADHDVWGKWRSWDEQALSFVANSDDADDSATFVATKLQYVRPSRGDREGLLVDQIEAQLNADDLEVTFASVSGS